jgi:hypothetical protein
VNENVNLLRDHIGSMPVDRFAVIDGALFDDLPKSLASQSVGSVSLFRNHPDADVEIAGPWMATLDGPESLNAVLGLSHQAGQACGVFWSCAEGETALLHHLRMINMVLMPTSDLTSHQAVMFRHWDPNVLAMVLDALNKDQLREFLGPADMIVFDAPDFGGIYRCVAGKGGDGGLNG